MKITDSIYIVGGGKWGFGISNVIDCNIYLIDTGDGLVLLDAGTGLEPERVDANIEAHGFSVKDIKAILITHYHGDHACGASRFQKLSGAPIYAPELEADAIRDGDEVQTSVGACKGGLYPLDFVYPKSDNVIPMKEGDTLTVGNITFTFYMCPGHSLQDMVVYADIDGKKCLFTGDFVFAQGMVLIQSLADVSVYPYAQAMRKIAELPIDAAFPGHGVFVLEGGHAFVDFALAKFNVGLLPPVLYYFA
ncbi:MAG: MBL fold metallo-hydrolase [Lachnospiraceae bacterium]|nr:MBL fold metallo-hydrolase [Lachnospiraceae bacterium]